MSNKDRVRRLLQHVQQQEHARQAAGRAQPSEQELEQMRAVLALLGNVGDVPDQHAVVSILDERHAAALVAAAFEDSPEKRAAASTVLAAIEQALPVRPHLTPEDLRQANSLLESSNPDTVARVAFERIDI